MRNFPKMIHNNFRVVIGILKGVAILEEEVVKLVCPMCSLCIYISGTIKYRKLNKKAEFHGEQFFRKRDSSPSVVFFF